MRKPRKPSEPKRPSKFTDFLVSVSVDYEQIYLSKDRIMEVFKEQIIKGGLYSVWLRDDEAQDLLNFISKEFDNRVYLDINYNYYYYCVEAKLCFPVLAKDEVIPNVCYTVELERYNAARKAYPEKKKKYEEDFAKWEKQDNARKEAARQKKIAAAKKLLKDEGEL